MRTSLPAISIAAAISVFNLFGLTASAVTLQLADRGSGRLVAEQGDRGSGRLVAEQGDRGTTLRNDFRFTGRIDTEQAYRGSGRLEA